MADHRQIDFGHNIDSFEREILDDINDKLEPYIQMSMEERYYLNGIVRKAKPKKILEIGTALGGSAALLLNATRNIDGAKVLSLDYSTQCYIMPEKQTGWIVPELFPELAKRWEFHGGGCVCQYLEGGGGGFDLLLLDTVHSNPGEFLNILEALPYLKDGAIVVLHDTSQWTTWGKELQCTNQILLSTLKGKRILFDDAACPVIPCIGGIVLDKIDHDMLWGLFTNIALPWVNSLPYIDYVTLARYFDQHYDRDLVDIFKRSAIWHRQRDLLIAEVRMQNQTPLLERQHGLFSAMIQFIRRIKSKCRCILTTRKL
ncbi:MAG: class I SAM-dependent methyltransferase [Desulfovibrio sp.]|jgi:predicted O-methyltransferase YrrM|nr:class I SAM-dependent methyltransferase [Desulfovibrio sp.]